MKRRRAKAERSAGSAEPSTEGPQRRARPSPPESKPPPQGGGMENLTGIMITVVSAGLLALFLFGLFTPQYRLLAISIPVGIATSALLVAAAVLGWEISKSQY